MQWLYAAFWILVGSMLLWQFQTYNAHLDRVVSDAGPQQQHFYFLNGQTNATTTTAAPPKPDGPDVKQISFAVEKDTPSPGFFTCHVQLKNVGNKKALDVQVLVTPFRGALAGNDPEGDRSEVHGLKDSDVVTQISQWVSFPDMAPDESITKDAVFTTQTGYNQGDNTNPQITFHAEKPAPAPVTPPAPPTPPTR